MTRPLVIVPTYNEARNIAEILEQVMGLSTEFETEFHVLVIDDNSADRTADIVREKIDIHHDRIFLIERAGKMGLGSAYLRGFRWALERDYTHICEMDADFSHDPEDLVALVQAAEQGADVAIGSRYVDGVRVINWPLTRLILSYGASLYTRMITQLPVRDVTAGFVCYRREVLETLDLDRIHSEGYSFQIEMKYRAWKSGFTLVEVPIIFTERTEGESKMSKAIVREAAWKVWELRLRHFLGQL